MKSRCTRYTLLLIFPVCIFAQIQITEQDVMRLDQAVGIYENSNTLGVQVDMKTEGPDQTWDLSNLAMGNPTTFTRYEVTHTAGTDLASFYPQCNYAHIESLVDNPSWVLTSFMRLTENRLQIAGRKELLSGETEVKGHGDRYYYPLPLTYGDSWKTAKIDSFGENDAMTTIMYKTIDAYGKIKLPAGTFDCLRMKTISKDSSEWGVNWFIQYMFLSRENLLLAIVQGQPDDTTHNFSQALYVQRFYSVTLSDIKDRSGQGQMPKAYQLRQNVPNPFNPNTTLVFEVPEYGRVDLSIYNIHGERVRTLYAGSLYAGTYTSFWNATDSANNPVPGGVYLCRLRAKEFSSVIRLLLVR